MCDSQLINDVLNPHEIKNLSITIKAILGILAFFMLATGYLLRKSRKYKSSIQNSIGALKSMKEDLEENNNSIVNIESATDKVLEAAVHVANEAEIK